MSSNVDAVPYMTQSKLPERILGSAVGRIFLICLQTVVGSVAVMLLLLIWQPADMELLKYALVAATGLLAGFSARRLLMRNTLLLKLATSTASTVLSLVVLALLSDDFVGIGLKALTANGPNWAGLLQFGLASVGAWLAVLVFRPRRETAGKPGPAAEVVPQSAPARSRSGGWFSGIKLPAGREYIQNLSTKVSDKVGRIRVRKPGSLKVKPPKATARTKKRKPRKIAPKRSAASKNNKPVSIKKKRKEKGNAKGIRLDGRVEHNCPYCLDPVKPRDSRGVKICPVCKTHHHADCWGITGACQIPHSQE